MHFARSESALALPRVLHSPPGFRQTDTSGVRRMVASGRWMRPVRALFSADNRRVSYRS